MLSYFVSLSVFSISGSEMCKNTCCSLVHWEKLGSGLRQNNQLVGERRNSEKTLNDVVFLPIGMRANTNGLGLEK